MSFYVHPNAICETKKIGEKTKIWAFSHILENAQIGSDCNICDGVFIENDVVVGDRVTVKCGVQLWDGITIENDVFIGPNATFTNDIFPRSKLYPETFLRTIVKNGSSIGANATILPGITIGEKAMVGAGAVVTKSVPPYAIVVGNPATITGYVGTSEASSATIKSAFKTEIKETSIKGVTIHTFPLIKDLRGDLSVGEFTKDIPFVPKRYFLVFDVPNSKVRGEHAHKKCHQFLVCVKGTCTVLADNGSERIEVNLNKPNIGIHLPPLTWGVQYKYSSDAILLVFASEYYDADDYIRDYNDFLKITATQK